MTPLNVSFEERPGTLNKTSWRSRHQRIRINPAPTVPIKLEAQRRGYWTKVSINTFVRIHLAGLFGVWPRRVQSRFHVSLGRSNFPRPCRCQAHASICRPLCAKTLPNQADTKVSINTFVSYRMCGHCWHDDILIAMVEHSEPGNGRNK